MNECTLKLFLICNLQLNAHSATGNMKNAYLFCVFFFYSLVILHAKEPAKSGCLEKEKALALLETVENSLIKARDAYPSCSSKPGADDDQEDIKEAKFRNCSEILATGRSKSGVYTIWPRYISMEKPLKVYCDMETDKGGWTVIQRRGKFPVQQDFNLDWECYKNGFGNLMEEFWLGNENIRVLCLEGCKIRFDIQDQKGVKRFAVYQRFNLSSNYSIDISGYSGNAGDAMKFHNNYSFSTKDKGNIELARRYQGGWWHGDLYHSNLNGLYLPGRIMYDSVYWYEFHHNYENLASVEMKVIPN